MSNIPFKCCYPKAASCSSLLGVVIPAQREEQSCAMAAFKFSLPSPPNQFCCLSNIINGGQPKRWRGLQAKSYLIKWQEAKIDFDRNCCEGSTKGPPECRKAKVLCWQVLTVHSPCYKRPLSIVQFPIYLSPSPLDAIVIYCHFRGQLLCPLFFSFPFIKH